jgi:hypothetical protein
MAENEIRNITDITIMFALEKKIIYKTIKIYLVYFYSTYEIFLP